METDSTLDNEAKRAAQLEFTSPLLAGYDTARDWLNKTKRDLERYRRDPLTQEGLDAMVNAAITLNHMRDWVYKLHVVGDVSDWPDQQEFRDWSNWLGQQCSDIRLMSDIANAAKHRSLDHPPKQSQRLSAGSIIYRDIHPKVRESLVERLRSFGTIEDFGCDASGEALSVNQFRHRAHIIHDNAGQWHYFLDVASRAIGYWEELLDAGVKPPPEAV